MEKENRNDKDNCEDADEMQKILAVVVRRRKTLPVKCMELHKTMLAAELQRLYNSTVVPEKNQLRENIRKVIQSMKKSKHIRFSLDDLNQGEKKFQKFNTKVNELNLYLKNKTKNQNVQNEAS